jgi:hypothetical protein
MEGAMIELRIVSKMKPTGQFGGDTHQPVDVLQFRQLYTIITVKGEHILSKVKKPIWKDVPEVHE